MLEISLVGHYSHKAFRVFVQSCGLCPLSLNVRQLACLDKPYYSVSTSLQKMEAQALLSSYQELPADSSRWPSLQSWLASCLPPILNMSQSAYIVFAVPVHVRVSFSHIQVVGHSARSRILPEPSISEPQHSESLRASLILVDLAGLGFRVLIRAGRSLARLESSSNTGLIRVLFRVPGTRNTIP